MAVDGGVVVALAAVDGATRLPPGAVVVPGFEDPHVHLLAMAAARCSLDCSHAGAPDLAALARVVRAAADAAVGGWVRGAGFDDALVAERRPPDRALLDGSGAAAAVVVHHAAGTVAYCNGEALRRLGADPDADDGTVGVERDASGRATGAVSKRAPLLDRVPPLAPAALDAGLDAVRRDLLAAGITAVTDATATNDASSIAVLARWAARGAGPRLTVMPGARAVLAGSSGEGAVVRLGHAKVLIDGDEPADLDGLVAATRAAGFPVALHVTDVDALDRALAALRASPGVPGRADRLEHLSLCLPEQVGAVAASRAWVVTQPAFLTHRGAKYAEQLTAVEHEWLYRVRSLLAAGVPVAASSDAPVVPAAPLDAMASAVARERNPAEAVDAATALALVTRAAAAASGTGGGMLRTGGPGDLVVLGADPLAVPADELAAIPVLATVVAGEVVHDTIGIAR